MTSIHANYILLKLSTQNKLFRDWSLITGRGATKREGVHVKRGDNFFFFCHAEGGSTKSFGVVFMW